MHAPSSNWLGLTRSVGVTMLLSQWHSGAITPFPVIVIRVRAVSRIQKKKTVDHEEPTWRSGSSAHLTGGA